MDWSKINVPNYSSRESRPTCGRMGSLDLAKLNVICGLINKSQAAVLQTAVLTYLQRNWNDHENRLIVEANRLGLTPEELFSLMASGKTLEDIAGKDTDSEG